MAECAVSLYVEDDMIVGVGSGDYCTSALQEIGRRLDAGVLQRVKVIAASDAASSEAAFVGVPLAASADHEKRPFSKGNVWCPLIPGIEVDVMFAEVDEIDVSHPKLPFIFGRVTEPLQPQIPRFKGVARKASLFVVLLDTEEKAVARLAHALPVVVEADEWESTAEGLDDIFVGDAEVWRRASSGLSNPSGGDDPYISAEGYNILDVKFDACLQLYGDREVEYSKIEEEMMTVPGVVSLGLLEDVADVLVIRSHSGPKVITKESLLESINAE